MQKYPWDGIQNYIVIQGNREECGFVHFVLIERERGEVED